MDHGTTAPRARVLFVGAYERDNFGDLLFLLVTEKYFPDEVELVSAAPIGADMTALMDRRVHAYAPLLSTERFDVIWTVGGQTGATDLRAAFRMSASPEAYARFRAASPKEQRTILAEAVEGKPMESPYIPSPLAYPPNAGALTVVNSVGLGGVRGVRSDRRRDQLIALLRGTDHISVRDQESYDYLSGLGIESRMVPDAVHAISRIHPAKPDPDSDLAIVQISSSILSSLGHREVAARLADSRQLKGMRIRLLMAGTATSHDSVDDFQQVIDHVKATASDVDIDVITDRRPFDLVDHMSRAKVVIGTSLHVRIIACAYGIPRVTLSRTKPTRYARAWDPDMPYDVRLDRLEGAIEDAIAAAGRPDVAARSVELTDLAHRKLEELVGRVLEQVETEGEGERSARAELRAGQRHRIGAVRDARVAALQAQLNDRDQRIARLQAELAEIKAGRSHRVGDLATRVVRSGARRLRRAVRRAVRR